MVKRWLDKPFLFSIFWQAWLLHWCRKSNKEVQFSHSFNIHWNLHIRLIPLLNRWHTKYGCSYRMCRNRVFKYFFLYFSFWLHWHFLSSSFLFCLNGSTVTPNNFPLLLKKCSVCDHAVSSNMSSSLTLLALVQSVFVLLLLACGQNLSNELPITPTPSLISHKTGHVTSKKKKSTSMQPCLQSFNPSRDFN